MASLIKFGGSGLTVVIVALLCACATAETNEPDLAPTSTEPLISQEPSSTLAASPSEETPEATPSILPTPTKARISDGTIRISTIGTASGKDLHQVISEWGTMLGPGLVSSRLLRFKSGPEVSLPNMEVVCDLCSIWRLVDPVTYEFTLRAEAQWPLLDPVNGRKVIAQDVVFSLERLRTPGWPHASLLDSVETITALNDSVVQLKLRYPDADLLQKLANPHAVIVASEVISTSEDLTQTLIGTGPWIWKDTLSGQIDLNVSDSHHHHNQPRTKRMLVTSARDQESGYTELSNVLADIAPVTEDQWRELEPKGFRSVVVPRQGRGLVLITNTRRPPFDDQEMRKALFYGMDPWEALEEAWKGLGDVAMGVPVVMRDWLLGRESLNEKFALPDVATTSLASVDPDPFVLKVANFGLEYRQYAEFITGRLIDLGFPIELEYLTRTEYQIQVWQEHDFQVALGPLPPVVTTSGFLFGLLHSHGQWNITGHDDATLDGLIERQSMELDSQLRGALIRDIQEKVLDSALLFMPIVTSERWAYAPNISEFFPNMAAGEGAFWALVVAEEIER